jgi:TolB-like protein/class 3 adenylate cyclase/tetratricopeptide (TPR) repeat protein
VQQATASPSVKRKLAAILSADVKGYSRLMAADEEGTLRTLNAYRQEMDALIVGRDGRIVGTAGDSVLAEFPSAVEAARCAVQIQEELAAHNAELPKDRRLEFRIGINLGDVMVEGDDLFGDGVNVAARLQALAEPGGVYVSGGIYDQIKGKLPFGADFLGEQTVKNMPELVRVYRLRADGATVRRRMPWRGRAWWAIAAAFGLLVIVAVGTTWYLHPWRASGPTEEDQASALPLPDRPSIAVLPFDNLSDNPEEEYFANGLTDDLITDLSQISGLFVIARDSAFTYKDQRVDVSKVGRELGVRYVLEGSVRRGGDKVRINAQLVDAQTRDHLWAERYDRDYTDIFALQDEVIGEIVSALAVELTETERTQLARLPTRNLEAYDYYLRAEQRVYGGDTASLAGALSLYDRAIALDSKFAEAYAGYARTAVDIWQFDFTNVLSGPVARQRAYEAAGRALELNSDLGSAYSVLGVLQVVDGAYDEALESMHRAVALDANSAEAHANLALVLTYEGQPDEALSAMETALRLNPKAPQYVHDLHAWVLFMNRRYEEALAELEADRGGSRSFFAPDTLAMAYAQLGRLDEAKLAVEAILERSSHLNIGYIRVLFEHFRRDEDLEFYLEALRKAGVPEWPYGFEGRPEDRLDASGIKALALGQTWTGHTEEGRPFIQEIGDDGTIVYRDSASFIVGTASLQGDRLCLEYPAFLMGRRHCGFVYRNPSSTSKSNSPYIYVNVDTMKYFAVEP